MRSKYSSKYPLIKKNSDSKTKKLINSFYVKQFSQMAGNDSPMLQKEIDYIVTKLERLLD